MQDEMLDISGIESLPEDKQAEYISIGELKQQQKLAISKCHNRKERRILQAQFRSDNKTYDRMVREKEAAKTAPISPDCSECGYYKDHLGCTCTATCSGMSMFIPEGMVEG